MSKFQGLKVAQVEAGLRSFNYLKPFPEEITRVLSAKAGLIDIFFCQDDKATQNVSRYNKKSCCTRYNTMLDSLRLAKTVNPGEKHPKASVNFAIISLHRFETISKKEKLEQVVNEVLKISRKIKLLFILHPPTRVALKNTGLFASLEKEPGCSLLPRQGFFEFNSLLRKAEFVITDGGSNQEERFYLGIPCLLLRSETERSEGLGGNVVLSNFDPTIINDFVLNYKSYRREPITDNHSPSRYIVNQLKEFI